MIQVCGMCLRDICVNMASVLRIYGDDGSTETISGRGGLSPEEIARKLAVALGEGRRVEINSYIAGPVVTTYMGSLMCAVHLFDAPHPSQVSQLARAGRWR